MKKVLIITYYWPPSGGGGVQRWLKFTKHLGEFNWEPVIYTPENPDFEIKDISLHEDIPKNLPVIKRPIWEPFSLYRKVLGKKAVQKQGVVPKEESSWLSKMAVWIRGNYFVPDARVFWVRPSVSYLTRYLKNNKIDIIITTGPPHSLHLIGLELKKRLGVKWLADFRDPWSQWDVLDQLKLTNKTRGNHQRLERAVLSSADMILTVSPSLQKSLVSLGAKNCKMITNGWDLDIPDAADKPEKFRIAHIGLLNSGRNPRVVWESLNELSNEMAGFKDKLEIYLAGTVEHEVLNAIHQYPELNDVLNYQGYQSHDEITEVYLKSTVLLLLVNNTDNGKWILPGKMYEYMAFNKAILALGLPESDASNILSEAGFSACFSYDDKAQVKRFIKEEYQLFIDEKKNSFVRDVDKYSRRELTKTLATCLDEI